MEPTVECSVRLNSKVLLEEIARGLKKEGLVDLRLETWTMHEALGLIVSRSELSL